MLKPLRVSGFLRGVAFQNHAQRITRPLNVSLGSWSFGMYPNRRTPRLAASLAASSKAARNSYPATEVWLDLEKGFANFRSRSRKDCHQGFGLKCLGFRGLGF